MFCVKNNMVNLFIIFLYLQIKETTSFKIIKFEVPHEATRGGSYFLKCLFELENDRLVNLKWYFNDKEFMRFEPNSKRQETQIFQLSTLNLEKSNVINSPERGSMVRLTEVQKEMTGKYKCEVTIESRFFTTHRENYMKVIPQPSTTSTAYPSFHRPKQLDLDSQDEEAPIQELISNSSYSNQNFNWFNLLLLVIYGLTLVMHQL